MSDYETLKQRTATLIKAHGQSMTLRQELKTYNPVTRIMSATSSDTVCYGIKRNYRIQDIDGTLIQATDIEVLLASDIAPKTGDKIIIGDSIFKVIVSKPIAPGAVDICYKVQVRA